MSFKIRTLLAPLLLMLAVVAFVACGQKQQPTRWDQAQQQSEGNAPATSDESVAGGEFNTFFPASEDNFEVVFSQEKKGFAQAKLKKDGSEVATLTISDTANNPDAREKFQQSSKTLAGHPVAQVGNQGTALLVADRFQVQVRSKDASFSQADREAWLQKFDLAGLSRLR